MIDSYNERGRGGRFLEREGRGEGGEKRERVGGYTSTSLSQDASALGSDVTRNSCFFLPCEGNVPIRSPAVRPDVSD